MRTARITAALLLLPLHAWGKWADLPAEEMPCETNAASTIAQPLGRQITELAAKLELQPNAGENVKMTAIYGKDNRVPIPKGFPWTSIGKLGNAEIGGHCTATMISECHALTASHCVSYANNTPHDPRKMKFVPSSGGGFSDVELFYFNPFGHRLRYDWAVLKLKGKPGLKTGWMGVRNSAVNRIQLEEKFILAGYSDDIGGNGTEATVDRNVFFKASDEHTPHFLYAKANSSKGSSGASIFYNDKDGKPWIVAVNTRAYLYSNGGQVQFAGVPEDLNKLANAVATGQFYNEMLDFMSKHPCK